MRLLPFYVWIAFFCFVGSVRGADRKELEQYEERYLLRWAERAVKVQKSERSRLLRELEAAFPGKASDAITEDDYQGWFDLLAGRNDQWWREDGPSPQMGEVFDKVAQRLELGPVPSISREEFAKYAKRVLREQAPPPSDRAPSSDEDADRVFRVLDRNGDGDLDDTEWTASLVDDKLFADPDGDGRISRGEYRDSFRRRITEKAEAVLAKSGEAPRPPGDLPLGKGRGVPEWFTRLDADKDGQLSLYECRTGGGSVVLYTEMDLNGDGYLTREEYQRYVRQREEKLNLKANIKR